MLVGILIGFSFWTAPKIVEKLSNENNKMTVFLHKIGVFDFHDPLFSMQFQISKVLLIIAAILVLAVPPFVIENAWVFWFFWFYAGFPLGIAVISLVMLLSEIMPMMGDYSDICNLNNNNSNNNNVGMVGGHLIYGSNKNNSYNLSNYNVTCQLIKYKMNAEFLGAALLAVLIGIM